MIVTDRSGSMLADGRRAEPARGGQEGGRHLPRRRPGPGARRRDRLQPEGRRAAVADARPRRRARGDAVGQGPPARPPPATRSRPRSPRSRARRPPRSCSSPTASRCAAATRSPPRGRPRQRKIPIYTVALGTANGTINGGAARAARPEDARRHRADHRRPRVHRRRRRRRSTRSTSASARRSRPRSSKREVTSLFAGGALALMAPLRALVDPHVRPRPLTLPPRLRGTT